MSLDASSSATASSSSPRSALAARIDEASGVTVREAVKHLESTHRDELLSA